MVSLSSFNFVIVFEMLIALSIIYLSVKFTKETVSGFVKMAMLKVDCRLWSGGASSFLLMYSASSRYMLRYTSGDAETCR